MTVSASTPSDHRAYNPINRASLNRGSAFGLILLGALLAFEIFNFSTTDFALGDLLGKLTFAGIRWSTILAIAFCGIDFAGIARLFTPEKVAHEASEVWYLFGAWLLAATMNAILTWWGVSMAIADHAVQSTAVIDPKLLTQIVPIFVAIMVWLIRVLIIGTLSYAGDKLFLQADNTTRTVPMLRSHTLNGGSTGRGVVTNPVPTMMAHPRQHTAPAASTPSAAQRMAVRPEPTYHHISGAQHASTPAQQNGMMAD
jgi:hypothetical protein